MIKLFTYGLTFGESAVVIRKVANTFEFGFPYSDELPVKTTTAQLMEKSHELKSWLRNAFDGQVLNLTFDLDEGDGICERQDVVSFKVTYGKRALIIGFPFHDSSPITIETEKVLEFIQLIDVMADIKLLERG